MRSRLKPLQYSCFDPKLGLYHYFVDSSTRPMNGDMPTPRLPPAGNKIGVPAQEAARPLPPDAKPAGTGWHARGVVVSCSRRGQLGAVALADTDLRKIGLAAAAVVVALYLMRRM